jgi:hypothetical protein
MAAIVKQEQLTGLSIDKEAVDNDVALTLLAIGTEIRQRIENGEVYDIAQIISAYGDLYSRFKS